MGSPDRGGGEAGNHSLHRASAVALEVCAKEIAGVRSCRSGAVLTTMSIEVKVHGADDVLLPDDRFAAVAPAGAGWVLLFPNRQDGEVERTYLPGSEGWPPDTAVAMAHTYIEVNDKRLT